MTPNNSTMFNLVTQMIVVTAFSLGENGLDLRKEMTLL
jgi:hypothetical protein